LIIPVRENQPKTITHYVLVAHHTHIFAKTSFFSRICTFGLLINDEKYKISHDSTMPPKYQTDIIEQTGSKRDLDFLKIVVNLLKGRLFLSG